MFVSRISFGGFSCVLGALGLFASQVTASARAETQILYYTTFTDHGAAPQECVQEGAIVRNEIDLYDHLDQWRWIIVCDELAWERVERHLGRASDGRGAYLALTQYDQRLTYIRATLVLHPLNTSPEMQVDHTIRHELAHILLKSGSCEDAERYGRSMLERLHAEQALFAELERRPRNPTVASR